MSVVSPFTQSFSLYFNFQDMFPTHLSSIPPNRDIDFCIHLDPGTYTISIPPHYMIPIDLKELKTQMQELLDKGFIHPIVLPWGRLIFVF